MSQNLRTISYQTLPKRLISGKECVMNRVRGSSSMEWISKKHFLQVLLFVYNTRRLVTMTLFTSVQFKLYRSLQPFYCCYINCRILFVSVHEHLPFMILHDYDDNFSPFMNECRMINRSFFFQGRGLACLRNVLLNVHQWIYY